jgi:DNA-binding NtrC family response regulator
MRSGKCDRAVLRSPPNTTQGRHFIVNRHAAIQVKSGPEIKATGNVRELRTAIEHGVVMATGSKITLRDLPMAVRQAAKATSPRGISVAEAFGEKSSPLDLHETERKLIMQALAATNGNVTAAAKKLGISRRTLHRRINEMNLAKAPAETTDASASKE